MLIKWTWLVGFTLVGFADPVTPVMVEVGHKDGACLRSTFALEPQSRISALCGQIHAHEEYLGAELSKPSDASAFTNQISRSLP